MSGVSAGDSVYLALSDKLDWTNLEGDRCPFDMSKPLPLQGPRDLQPLGRSNCSSGKCSSYVYQKKLNITKPQTKCEGISVKEPDTIFYKPRGVVYLNRNNLKRHMRADELYKFYDGTLKDVRDNLHDMLQNFVLGYNEAMPTRKWSEKDQEQTPEMLKLIDDLLLERQIMRSLECYVGGRLNETDYKL
ncbi:hypothetical protein Tco_0510728 [Tanacetum coccineum]